MSDASPSAPLAAIAAQNFSPVEAMGGWRGVIESGLPTLVFVIIMAVAPQQLTLAVGAALVIACVAALVRIVQRQSLMHALSGAGIAALSAVWAWRSGTAGNFYATGFLINAAALSACIVSILLRYPLVGLLVVVYRGENLSADGWQNVCSGPGVRRLFNRATGMFAGLHALRLLVEIPLYLGGRDWLTALGIARLVLGLPLFALVAWGVWMVIRPLMVTQPVEASEEQKSVADHPEPQLPQTPSGK